MGSKPQFVSVYMLKLLIGVRLGTDFEATLLIVNQLTGEEIVGVSKDYYYNLAVRWIDNLDILKDQEAIKILYKNLHKISLWSAKEESETRQFVRDASNTLEASAMSNEDLRGLKNCRFDFFDESFVIFFEDMFYKDPARVFTLLEETGIEFNPGASADENLSKIKEAVISSDRERSDTVWTKIVAIVKNEYREAERSTTQIDSVLCEDCNGIKMTVR